MATAPSITFYDFASGPGENPPKLQAPSPWKIRYALNYKNIPYRTQFVDFPEIPTVRQALGVKTTDTYIDGSTRYTLPMLKDESTGALLGETWDIAVYLEKQYPEGPSLFPNGSIGLIRKFDEDVERDFGGFIMLCVDDFPFNPESAEVTKRSMVVRFGKKNWDEVPLKPDERAQALQRLQGELTKVAALYGMTEGPFLMGGDEPSYADFVVGARLGMFECSMKEWVDIKEWNGGVWKELLRALEPWKEVK
ncbi:hypothetical protein GGR57DRAFT_104981 [Xylariaceae sp. FL1272]|nr:hypothetical protein GGR57DRAFT_104981 [Xylariaceae sp. FL1272]